MRALSRVVCLMAARQHMGQVKKLWLSCYLVLLSIDSKNRQQDSHSSVTWPIYIAKDYVCAIIIFFKQWRLFADGLLPTKGPEICNHRHDVGGSGVITTGGSWVTLKKRYVCCLALTVWAAECQAPAELQMTHRHIHILAQYIKSFTAWSRLVNCPTGDICCVVCFTGLHQTALWWNSTSIRHMNYIYNENSPVHMYQQRFKHSNKHLRFFRIYAKMKRKNKLRFHWSYWKWNEALNVSSYNIIRISSYLIPYFDDEMGYETYRLPIARFMGPSWGPM